MSLTDDRRPGRNDGAGPAVPEQPRADHTSYQYGGVQQNADHIHNSFAETLDHLHAGKDLLRNGLYPDAIRSLQGFLEAVRRGGLTEDPPAAAEEKRSEAHLLIALAMLRRTRPSYRSPQEIEGICQHLHAAQARPLSAVLAAVVREDYYDSDRITVPRELAALAARFAPERLTPEEWTLLGEHVTPVPGTTWEALRQHRQELRPYLAPATAAPHDPYRQAAVARYFTPTPTPPVPVNPLPAHVMAGVGAALILGTCAGLFAADDLASALCVSLFLLAAGAGLVAGAVSKYGSWSAYGRKRRQFEAEWALAEPKPTDQEMQLWLEQDRDRIQARGAERHRLSIEPLEHGGDLLVHAQTVVGISNRTRLQTRTRPVPRTDGQPGFVPVTVTEPVPVARVRPGYQDGELRADHYHVLTLYLTRTRVCVYQCELEFQTGMVLSDEAQSFRYDDVVEISSRTVTADRRTQREANALFDDGSGRYIEIFADDRFELAIVNGNTIGMSIGLSAHATTGQGRRLAWGNQQVLGIVERMVWSQRERLER